MKSLMRHLVIALIATLAMSFAIAGLHASCGNDSPKTCAKAIAVW
jgi:hypothetical protein